MAKEYLGDGVYVAVENGMLKLTTENGISTTNTIYLEVEVAVALFDYFKRLTAIGEEEFIAREASDERE